MMQTSLQANTTATLDKFFSLLGEKIEIDDDMRAMFDEYKASLVNATSEIVDPDGSDDTSSNAVTKVKGKTAKNAKKPRAPRPATGYNMFMTETVKELKAQGETGKLMPMVAKMWKEMSDEAKAVFNDKAKANAVIKEETSDNDATTSDATTVVDPESEAKPAKGKTSKGKKQKVTGDETPKKPKNASKKASKPIEDEEPVEEGGPVEHNDDDQTEPPSDAESEVDYE